MSKSRIFLILVFLAAIAWLVLSPRKGNRRGELNQALKAGTLGRLPDSTARGLNRLMLAYRDYLGIREPVCLNCAMDSSAKLRVYTCGPAVLRLTGCAAGNAIYDRELNAVFIDGSLVSPAAWNAKGTFGAGHTTLPFLEVYLKFVLLHELGHYFLHRDAGQSFDIFSGSGSATLRRYEAQADSFAVAHFTAIMAVDTAGTLFSPAVFENLAMNVDAKASASDKTLLCLTLMARNINLGMLFGVSPYSEFYADKAHPTFMSRSAGFLSKALESAPVKDKYYAKADWIRAQLLEISRLVAHRAILEVSVPAPLLNLGFDRDGLLVQTLDSGLYRMGYEQLKLPARPGVTEAGLERVAANKVFFDLDALYSFRTGGSFSSGNGQLFALNGGHWQAAAFHDGVPRNLDKVPVQRQPAAAWVYLGIRTVYTGCRRTGYYRGWVAGKWRRRHLDCCRVGRWISCGTSRWSPGRISAWRCCKKMGCTGNLRGFWCRIFPVMVSRRWSVLTWMSRAWRWWRANMIFPNAGCCMIPGIRGITCLLRKYRVYRM
ncbi:MAG: hypothetical protein V4577_04520 [Bacteroidota bacterium]